MKRNRGKTAKRISQEDWMSATKKILIQNDISPCDERLKEYYEAGATPLAVLDRYGKISVETIEYREGSVCTGPPMLPAKSPAEQES